MGLSLARLGQAGQRHAPVRRARARSGPASAPAALRPTPHAPHRHRFTRSARLPTFPRQIPRHRHAQTGPPVILRRCNGGAPLRLPCSGCPALVAPLRPLVGPQGSRDGQTCQVFANDTAQPAPTNGARPTANPNVTSGLARDPPGHGRGHCDGLSPTLAHSGLFFLDALSPRSRGKSRDTRMLERDKRAILRHRNGVTPLQPNRRHPRPPAPPPPTPAEPAPSTFLPLTLTLRQGWRCPPKSASHRPWRSRSFTSSQIWSSNSSAVPGMGSPRACANRSTS